VTLRERLAAKQRRRVVVPVSVASPDGDRDERLRTAQTEMLAAAGTGDAEALAAAQQRIDDIDAEGVEEVAFTAVDFATWEKVSTAHPSKDGTDSGVDWVTALPVVAALCADDESLQDDEAWTALLDGWSHGERLTLWIALHNLNELAPAPFVPKG